MKRRALWTIVSVVAVSAALSSASMAARADGKDDAAVPGQVPTFTKDVAPILYNHCVTCHRPGEIAPMTLLSYAEARPWAKAIKQKVESREMPPWGADPAHSLKMRNDRSLS